MTRLLSLFPTSACPYSIPSFLFHHLSLLSFAKTQKCNQHSSFLPILAYTLLPCVQIFIFPEFLPDHISFVFALSSAADSSFFVRLPCLLTPASCHSPCSPALSPSLSVQVSPFPRLIALLLPPVLLQVPQLPADARCSTQRTCHSAEPAAPKTPFMPPPSYLFSPCLECINRFRVSDCVCGLNVGSGLDAGILGFI